MTSYSNVQKQQLSQLGAYLQEKRQDQGKSIEDISLQTYIRAQLLKSIENGDPTDLPQPIFVQGFIRRYADALGLDGANFAKQFPVHSIPNTPRPIPRPAVQVDMSYQPQATDQGAQVQPKSVPSIPKPIETAKPLKPAVGAMPLVNEEPVSVTAPAMDSERTSEATGSDTEKATSTTAEKVGTPTKDIALDSRPMTDNELTALGLSSLADTADRANSPGGSLLGKEDTVPPSLDPAPITPSPRPVGSTLTTTDNKTKPAGINWLPLGIGVAVTVGVLALLIPAIFSGGKKSEPVEAEAPAIEQSEPADITQAAAPAPDPVEAPEPPPVATSDAPVSLAIEITEAGPSWVSIDVDGELVFEGAMQPGTKEIWEGQEAITLNVGNAGAAIISANGSTPAPAGEPGGVELLTFTPEE